jgi:hypothetical protein
MRGLTDYANYGSLPSSARERKDLAAQVRILLNQNFTAFVRENPRLIRHIPGFWIDESGEVNLWQKHDYRHPLLLIPYRNPAGSIQACQIRFTGAIRPNQKRYLWLSLPRLESAGSGTPLHFSGGQKEINRFSLPKARSKPTLRLVFCRAISRSPAAAFPAAMNLLSILRGENH